MESGFTEGLTRKRAHLYITAKIMKDSLLFYFNENLLNPAQNIQEIYLPHELIFLEGNHAKLLCIESCTI